MQLRIGIVLAVPVLCGVSASSSKGAVDYARDIQPIFAANCYKCHGAEKQKSALRLDRKADALAGGESGEKAIVPGNAMPNMGLAPDQSRDITAYLEALQ